MSGYSAPRPISEGDEVAGFDRGEPSLDAYLRGRDGCIPAGPADRAARYAYPSGYATHVEIETALPVISYVQ